MEHTMHQSAWLNSGPVLGYGEPIRYEVDGLPPNEQLSIHRSGGHNRFRWQILIVKDGISSGWLGEYLSPEEALAIVNCMRNADELVQDVINIWGPLVQAGQAKTFTPEFKALVDAACEYRNAK